LNEVGKSFGQFFGILFAIIGYEAMNTSMGKSLIMMALVFMVALYYLVLVIVTMLQFQIQNLLPFMILILLIGSVVSSLALMMISPTIAEIHLGLWFLIFALMCYKNRKELYQMIPQRIKKTQSGNSEIAAVELGSFQSRENLNV
jgi:glycerol-3-phosphate acyltransferase PlsY